MLRDGILNPQINSLLSRVRHTNTLVIADKGFPYWPAVETIDISLIDDMPRVLDVLRAIRTNFVIGRVFIAEEFQLQNAPSIFTDFVEALSGVKTEFEPHIELKKRVPHAVGLIRTGDSTQYANLIVESA